MSINRDLVKMFVHISVVEGGNIKKEDMAVCVMENKCIVGFAVEY